MEITTPPPEPPATTPGTIADRNGLALVRGIGANAATLAAMSVRGLFGVLVARLLGAAVLGAFVLANAWINLLSQIGVLGLDTAAMAYAARTFGTGDRGAARRVLNRAVGIGLVVSGALTLVVLWLTGHSGIAAVDDPGFARSLAILALGLPALALSRISSSVSRGLQVMNADFYAHGVAGTSVMLVALVACVRLGCGALSPAIAVTLGAIAAALVAYRSARALTSPTASSADPRASSEATSGLVTFALPIAGYSLLNLLMIRLDVLMLGFYVGTVAGVTPLTLGIYAASVDLAGGLRKVRQVFDLAFAPIAAHTAETTDPQVLRARLGQVGRWVLIFVCPAIGLTFLAGGSALSLYGPGFRAGAPWLAVLVIATGAHSFLGLIETVLMVKRPSLNLYNSVTAVTIQIVASLVLIPRYGVIGAAIATLGAYGIQGVLRFAELRHVEGWSWPWSSTERPVFASALSLGLGGVVRLAVPAGAGEALAALTFVIVYVAVLRLMGLDDEDRALVDALRARRRANAA